MIKLTVGMPAFNSEKIAWIAFEGLIRQKTDFDWELLIIEEKENAICDKLIIEYRDKLKKANCVNIEYKQLDKWIPLSLKYVEFGKMYNSDSETFVIQSTDCFSNPNRLQVANYYITKEIDWVMYKKAMFYRIGDKKTILFDWDTYDLHPCGCDMSFKISYLKLLPNKEIARGVDGWLYASMKNKIQRHMGVYWDTTDNWKYSINTHGLNNISDRSKFFKNPTKPFVKTDMNATDYLPNEVKEKLLKI